MDRGSILVAPPRGPQIQTGNHVYVPPAGAAPGGFFESSGGNKAHLLPVTVRRHNPLMVRQLGQQNVDLVKKLPWHCSGSDGDGQSASCLRRTSSRLISFANSQSAASEPADCAVAVARVPTEWRDTAFSFGRQALRFGDVQDTKALPFLEGRALL
ncbi:hypothetical protein EVAR_16895_1 [Eumeta japonica]|uniref:Uncharacterized protein n=1 Tax=Eumeta variegata TaxID=151549 RepID=A0A4C1TV84_EUMVA|nr:hypothetical protein EVAR_16895_1 [Eumeta japonica]